MRKGKQNWHCPTFGAKTKNLKDVLLEKGFQETTWLESRENWVADNDLIPAEQWNAAATQLKA